MLCVKYGFRPSEDLAVQTSDLSFCAAILGLRRQTSDLQICCANLRSEDLLHKLWMTELLCCAINRRFVATGGRGLVADPRFALQNPQVV